MNQHIMSDKEHLFCEVARLSAKHDFPIYFTPDLIVGVDVSDVFYWNMADVENISNFDELKELEECLKLTANGDILWAARKRKKRPQDGFMQRLPNEDKILFENCGPERINNFDNPKV